MQFWLLNETSLKIDTLLSNLGTDRMAHKLMEMWTLTKLSSMCACVYLLKTQSREISLLATIVSILAYTSDVSQWNKERKRSLGLIVCLASLGHIKLVSYIIGQVSLKHTGSHERKGYSKTEAENRKLLVLREKGTKVPNWRVHTGKARNQILFLTFHKQSQASMDVTFQTSNVFVCILLITANNLCL